MAQSSQKTKKKQVLVLTKEGQSLECVDTLREHFEVIEVHSFDQALAKLRQGPFYMVISTGTTFLPLERALIAEQTAVILETISQGVAILSLEGTIIWVNRKMNNLPAETLNRLTSKCVELFKADIVSEKINTTPRRFMIESRDERCLEVTAAPILDGNNKIQNIAVIVWDVTATRELQKKLDAIDNAGKELVRIEAEAIKKLDFSERLKLLEEKVIKYTKEILGFDNFCIRLLNKNTNKLELILSSGMTEEAKSTEIFASSEGNGISGYVAATGRSYICPDVKKDRRYLPGIDNAASSLTVPLFLHDQVIGVFNIESDKPGAFNEDDRQFAEIFGRYVAIALHILDLLVVERSVARNQVADNILTEITEPLNDILVEANALMEEYIGNDDLRHRLQLISDKADEIRNIVKQKPEEKGIIGEHKEKDRDPIISGKQILVADDEQIIKETLFNVLRKYGARVDSAESGTEAIELLRANDYQYDLVITDIRMPYQDGYAVFREIREHRPALPVIFMTGFEYDSEHRLIRAREEGLAGLLWKPFRVNDLLVLVRDVLREFQGNTDIA